MSEIIDKVDDDVEQKFEYLDSGLFYLVELSEKEWKEYWKPSDKQKYN